MVNEGYYLLVNQGSRDTPCCRFNLSMKHTRQQACRQDPAGLGHLLTGSDPANNGSYVYGEEFYFMGSNLSWADVRHITTNFTSDVTLYCDASDVSRGQNLSDVNFSIVSAEDYIQRTLGERYVSTATVIILTIVYILILLTGVLGNVCTCIVITRNRSLHTATNYYLFSLAFSDVMALVLGELRLTINYKQACSDYTITYRTDC